ncbi:MAG: hypothetical protein Q4C01_00070 [Clostridia bacterium]|nr:hypothetical protein [Clostridia bacterium]
MERAYFKQKMSGGKGAVSRAVDAVFLRAILFALLYLLLPKSTNRLAVAILLGIALCIVLQLIANARLKRFIARESLSIKNEIRRERLLIMPYDELRALIGEDKALIQKAEPITPNDLLETIKSPATVCYATADYTPQAKTLAQRLNPSLKLLDVCEAVDIQISDSELSHYIKSKMLLKKQQRRIGARLSAIGTWKFLLLGALITTLSFFTRYAVYYRLLASAAFIAFAVLSPYRRSLINSSKM